MSALSLENNFLVLDTPERILCSLKLFSSLFLNYNEQTSHLIQSPVNLLSNLNHLVSFVFTWHVCLFIPPLNYVIIIIPPSTLYSVLTLTTNYVPKKQMVKYALLDSTLAPLIPDSLTHFVEVSLHQICILKSLF